jgi:hypothetical protein
MLKALPNGALQVRWPASLGALGWAGRIRFTGGHSGRNRGSVVDATRYRRVRRSGVGVAVTVAAVLAVWSGTLAGAAPRLVKISSDPYTTPDAQHRTEVEPDTLSVGSTVLSVFQAGRVFGGGASNIGFARSSDSGGTWTHGFLPGTTVSSTPPNPTYRHASDPSIAFDAKHNVWMVSYLDVRPPLPPSVVDVLASRSTDGGKTWGMPVIVSSSGQFLDKNWTVCDNTASSPFYGNCYTEFDNASLGDLEQLSTSHDGGKTWGAAVATADGAHGLGGQPLVQPNGTVVVPYEGIDAPFVTISSFSSTNGGASLTKSVTISATDFKRPNSDFRSGPLPSAEIDKAGTVYVTWSDCRFESNCSANDLMLTTSTSGTLWSVPRRIPIDPVGSGIDHFIPGLAVDKSTSGQSAHLALAYYYFTQTNCTTATCRLDVGYLSSVDGGVTWSGAIQLAGPMHLDWLAETSQGRMVGDYISTSIADGHAMPVVATASAPTGTTFHESMAAGRLAVTGGSNALANDAVVASGAGSARVPSPQGRVTAY